jgi:signal transduction histidine kinase
MMPKFALKLQRDGEDISRFSIGGNSLLIGRSSKSDVVLADSAISREHARLRMDRDHLVIEDLGSTNGVVLNGERVTSASIRAGDIMLMGKYTLLVETDDSQEVLRDTGAFIAYEDASALHDRFVQSEENTSLVVLYQAAQLLGKHEDSGELLEEILSLVFGALPSARRGFILSRFHDGEEPQVQASLSRHDSSFELPISKTMIDHVFDSKTAVLTSNALIDPRFAEAESIFEHGVHAAMCVPMCGRINLMGAIYVDTDADDEPFSEEHLEFLTVMGHVVGVAVENLRLQEERIEQERLVALGEAVAGIGHCMKNILTTLKASGEFIDIGQGKDDWNWVKKGWQSMGKALVRFESLVNDLLTYARKTEIHVVATNVNSLVGDVLETLRPQAAKRDITITFDKEELEAVLVDGDALYQALANLVDNALDACSVEGEGGKVEVSTWQNPFGTYIQVRDDGVGIPPENLSKICQAFFSTKGHGGTGLGLACTYRIAEQHGGVVTVESEVGKGTAFTIFLPSDQSDRHAISDSTVKMNFDFDI